MDACGRVEFDRLRYVAVPSKAVDDIDTHAGGQAHLAKVALEGSIHRLGLAAEYGGRVVLGHCQRVAAVHPPVPGLALVDGSTGCGGPSRTLPHNCTHATHLNGVRIDAGHTSQNMLPTATGD